MFFLLLHSCKKSHKRWSGSTKDDDWDLLREFEISSFLPTSNCLSFVVSGFMLKGLILMFGKSNGTEIVSTISSESYVGFNKVALITHG